MVSPHLSLHSVLERAATCLEKAQRREKGESNDGGRQRGNGEGDEEEEESDMDDGDDNDNDDYEEDDDDGYYGDDIDADTAMDDEPPSHTRYQCPPVTNNTIIAC